MQQRFLSIWFRQLKTDWMVRRRPALAAIPFVLAAPDHGRIVVTAVHPLAAAKGVYISMTVADARAMIPALEVLDDKPEYAPKLTRNLAEWLIRYTPVVAVDPPDGLLLDITGCAHLWGGEKPYLADIHKRLEHIGYGINCGIADTIGTAWAIARFGKQQCIIESGCQAEALLPLPPTALRLEAETIERLEKLGLRQTGSFINMPRSALRRRFGKALLYRLDQALGQEEETIEPVIPSEPYRERLPCIEPIVTATGIEIAIERLLGTLCGQLIKEEKGLRTAILKCYRVDGKVETIEIGTHRPTANTKHLFKLFELKIDTIEPALGIELFTLEAQKVTALSPVQEILWEHNAGLDAVNVSELLDRIEGKMGPGHIYRFLPAEHYWPERSFIPALSINEKTTTTWRIDKPRPLQILAQPQPIEVAAPIPDYPPMNFRYKGVLHKITKADGPERIEQEWWLQEGQHRDYYNVEDESGRRYWLFRAGHYEESYQWFIHGFFA
ncbi:MAG: DNA polymerase Y family protein [Chitinophagaceae bacterium]